MIEHLFDDVKRGFCRAGVVLALWLAGTAADWLHPDLTYRGTDVTCIAVIRELDAARGVFQDYMDAANRAHSDYSRALQAAKGAAPLPSWPPILEPEAVAYVIALARSHDEARGRMECKDSAATDVIVERTYLEMTTDLEFSRARFGMTDAKLRTSYRQALTYLRRTGYDRRHPKSYAEYRSVVRAMYADAGLNWLDPE